MNTFVFGEILWDIYPDKKTLGGAPFNFAANLVKLGGKAFLVSAVGDDALGAETREMIKRQGVDDTYTLTVDKPTSVCNVSLKNGTPTFTLDMDSAYDKIVLSDEQVEKIIKTPRRSLYFGTLAQRDDTSQDTLRKFLQFARWDFVFYDVNLRAPFFSHTTVVDGLSSCTICKISREEALMFDEMEITDVRRAAFADEYKYYEALCVRLAQMYRISTILLTLDKDGAMAYEHGENKFYYEKSKPVSVVSTVGGGDGSFAAFAHFKMLEQNTGRALKKAIAVSSYIVSKIESIPEYSDELCIELMR